MENLSQLQSLDVSYMTHLTGQSISEICGGTTSELTHWWSRRFSSATEPESIDDLEPLILQEAYWCVSLKLGCGGTTSELTHWWIRGSSSATESESIDQFEPRKLLGAYWCVSLKLGCGGTTSTRFHWPSVSDRHTPANQRAHPVEVTRA